MADDVLADIGDVDLIPEERGPISTKAGERKKGRGGKDDMDEDGRYAGKHGIFDSLSGSDAGGPLKCEWLLQTLSNFERIYIVNGCHPSSLADSTCAFPRAAVEGWIVFVTGVHEEAQEDDVLDAFSEFGEVKNINLNLERQTGLVKGYALIEYASKKEAEAAIGDMNGKELLGQQLKVDWAFKHDSESAAGGRDRDRAERRRGDRR